MGAKSSSADVAILAAPTHAACAMLRNTANACVESGLAVDLLVPRAGSWYESTAGLYSNLPVRLKTLDLRGFPSYAWGYPRPIAWLGLIPRFVRMLDRLNPKSVMTHIDSQDAWRAIHWWAQRRGVPGLVLQEGIAAPAKHVQADSMNAQEGHLSAKYRLQMILLRLLLPNCFRQAELNQYADHVCAWGAAMKRQLVAAGRLPEGITVTGNPRLDHIRSRGALADERMATVLFAHQHQLDQAAELDFCRLVIDVCANRLGCRLIFRPHPRSSLWGSGAYRIVNEVAKAADAVTIADKGDVTDYLDQATVFLTVHSSSAYDATLHGIPLVIADWVDPFYRLNAADYGAALQVDSPAELSAALGEALWNTTLRRRLYSGGQQFVEDHLHALDGGASQRVAATVARVISAPGGAGAADRPAGRTTAWPS